jgi:signal transduction histidine kinase
MAVFVAFSFCLFALWQLFNHGYMMHLPMTEYHLISLVIETLGAAVVAFFVLGELARKNAQLETLDRQKDLLTNALVHDLRQPLTAVLAGLETTEEECDLPAQTKELLSIAREGGSELLSMVNDLLDVTRLEAGVPTVQLSPVAPEEFMRSGVRPLQAIAENNRIDLSVAVPDGLPEILGDSERLQRVVMNIVGNALKFTPSGGTVKVVAGVDPAAKELTVSVSDTGLGIPQDQQGRIFDKFAMADSRKAGARGSTGLGLAFSKMVVEAHGGRIWVESEPGRGATFTFTIPIGRPT